MSCDLLYNNFRFHKQACLHKRIRVLQSKLNFNHRAPIVEPSKILELLKVAVSTNAVDERIPVPVQVSNSPHQLVLLTSVSDLSAQCPGDGAAVNEESNLDPLNFTPGSTNEEAEEANSISIDCSPEHDENFEEVKCNTLNILSSPKKEQEVANSELNPEPQNFSLDFANEDNTSQLEGTSQTCHEEPPASKSESQSLKRRGVQMIADRFIKRKNVKDTYDMELHEQKMRLLRKEVEIKEIELENRVTEIEMTKKIRQLEYEIKQNELEIVQMDKNIKQMELKVKTDQYSEYSNS
ncbi:hypothetical protein C0J52_07023 [Blattella germanica]|nr:hypothetical protein C0J52_07023 [Blattella germanica]